MARAASDPIASFAIYSVNGAEARAQSDHVAVEEPLEIRLRARFDGAQDQGGEDLRTLSLTMRTPGGGHSRDEDAELALGFLFSEGLVRSRDEVAGVEFPESGAVLVTLRPDAPVAWRSLGLERHFFTTSACGVCGKSALAALAAAPPEPLRPAASQLSPAVLHQLPKTLRQAQATFSATGGLHAAGLFDPGGRLQLVREDIGRHNAVDKLLGAELRAGSLPLHDRILVVSGRASFELVQKARMACIPIFVAVSAPSSLAVELAREAGMTLVGFARDGRCNVYSTPERLALIPAAFSSSGPIS